MEIMYLGKDWCSSLFVEERTGDTVGCWVSITIVLVKLMIMWHTLFAVWSCFMAIVSFQGVLLPERVVPTKQECTYGTHSLSLTFSYITCQWILLIWKKLATFSVLSVCFICLLAKGHYLMKFIWFFVYQRDMHGKIHIL